MTEEKRPGGDDPGAHNKKTSKNKYTPHDPGAEPPRPALQLKQGELGDVVREAARILQEADAGIYRWGGRLVRLLVVPPAPPESPIKRDPSMQVLVAVTPGWITLRLCDVAGWWRWDARAKDWRAADPPPRLAALLVDASDECDFPVLAARASCVGCFAFTLGPRLRPSPRRLRRWLLPLFGRR